jgi:hypothetical protein
MQPAGSGADATGFINRDKRANEIEVNHGPYKAVLFLDRTSFDWIYDRSSPTFQSEQRRWANLVSGSAPDGWAAEQSNSFPTPGTAPERPRTSNWPRDVIPDSGEERSCAQNGEYDEEGDRLLSY